jgi:hypothetical protein
MSVAWPLKTVKGLGPLGRPESADPYAESGKRRARFFFAAVGSCKTLIMGSNPIVASGQREATAGNAGQQTGGRSPCFVWAFFHTGSRNSPSLSRQPLPQELTRTRVGAFLVIQLPV